VAPVDLQPTLRVQLGDPELISEMVARPGVLRSGHFRMLSGLHSDRFLAFSRLAAHPHTLELIGGYLTPVVSPWQPHVVVAPSTAGVALASQLSRRLAIPLLLADLDDDGRATGLLGDIDIADRRALLVNDVVTTGQGLQSLASVARDAGAQLAGACWFLRRADIDVAALLDAPTACLGTLELAAWPADQCPGCRDDTPLQQALDLN
jgi:orotate phosphoribosyltransferase